MDSIRIKDHTVAGCVAILVAVSFYFVYRAARDRHELETLRAQNRVLGREIAQLEESFRTIRTYTKSAESLASGALTPADLKQRDELGLIANNPEHLGFFGRLSVSLKAAPLPLSRLDDEGKRSDLEQFSGMMASLGSFNRDTDVVVRRLRSLATLLRYNRDVMRGVPSTQPTQGRITSEFGMRLSPFEGKKHYHTGIDIAAPSGAKVVAPADGTVSFVGNFESLGRTVVIDHGNGMLTRYGHLSRYFVREGQVVRRGEQVAAVGSSGRSTGPHLHYEVWVRNTPVNPRDFFFDLDDGKGEQLAKADKDGKGLLGMGGD